jgi:hypothetical protein
LASVASPGFPVLRILWPRRATIPQVAPLPRPLAVPAMDHRVAPNLASSSPLVSVIPRVAPFPHALLRRPLTQNLGCPAFCVSGLAGDGAPSRLESRILRRCRVTDHQVAPNSGLSVSPMIFPQVAPLPDLPAPADGRPEFPLGSAPSGCASGSIFESPRISAPTGLASSVNFRVAPALYPSGCADRLISRSP